MFLGNEKKTNVMKKEDNLTFKLIESKDGVFVYFSDGNVLVADHEGLMAYSTNKTIAFKSADTTVHTTYISSKDEDVTVWVLPTNKKKKIGLQNDFRLPEAEMTIREYIIPQKHYDALKTFIWKQSIDKAWPDD